jgi:ribosomal-protein-alanine N-acetyltransferase
MTEITPFLLEEISSERCLSSQPVLHTPRLILRPFTLADASITQQLAGAVEIATTTVSIPYPYEDGMAEAWIQTHPDIFKQGKGVYFAIELRENQRLCGAISLRIDIGNINAELGYWIGTPYWGNGYATEAAKAILRYGFEELNLNRIYASHFATNPASGRVLQKVGMRYEGCSRQHIFKWGKFEDLEMYGILKGEMMG